MSHISTSLVTHINESCHTYEWVMSHQGMPIKASYNDTSYHTYERVKSHITTSQVTHINKSCCTYQRVMLHIWMSHVTRTNDLCHTYEWVLSHIWMSHVMPGHADQGVVLRRVVHRLHRWQILRLGWWRLLLVRKGVRGRYEYLHDMRYVVYIELYIEYLYDIDIRLYDIGN